MKKTIETGNNFQTTTYTFDVSSELIAQGRNELAEQLDFGTSDLPAEYYASQVIADILKDTSLEDSTLSQARLYFMKGRPGSVALAVEKLFNEAWIKLDQGELTQAQENGDNSLTFVVTYLGTLFTATISHLDNDEYAANEQCYRVTYERPIGL